MVLILLKLEMAIGCIRSKRSLQKWKLWAYLNPYLNLCKGSAVVPRSSQLMLPPKQSVLVGGQGKTSDAPIYSTVDWDSYNKI